MPALRRLPSRRAVSQTARAVGLAAGLAALAGCGSASPAELPPPATPDPSPPLREDPTGRTVRLDGTPTGVVVDDGTGLAAVPLRAGSGRGPRLVLVRPRSGQVVRRAALPRGCRPTRPTLEGVRGPVLVPCQGIDRLVRLALPTGRVLSVTPTGPGPRVAVATLPRGRVLVSDGDAATLSVIDGGRRTGTFRTDEQPGGLVAVDGGARVGVLARRARTLQLLDARTGARGARTPYGVGPGDAIAARDAEAVWGVDTGGGAVLVGEVEPEPLVRRRVYAPLGPDALAYDRARDRLWVTVPGRNSLMQIGAYLKPGTIRELPIVRGATGVGVDPLEGLVLVTGAGADQLQIIDPARLVGRRGPGSASPAGGEQERGLEGPRLP